MPKAAHKSHFALVLPGAVAKGAYEAGVIDILAQRDLRIDRIIATSSGALNGVAYAAGIRAGNEREMARRLVTSWIDNGGWGNSLGFTPWNLIRGRGISDRSGLLRMLTELIQPCRQSKKREVELRIIVAPLHGVPGAIGKNPATTYEKLLKFRGKDFDTAEGLAKIFDATTAACAFPGLFAPVDIEGLGPCVDGGTVNNAPIKYALDECDVNRVIMPVPFPAVMPDARSLGGFGLFNHLVEILINERLYRDLKDAEVVNRELRGLEKLAEQKTITPEQLDAIRQVLQIRQVEISEIRPLQGLHGSAFAGFFSRAERLRLVNEGRQAAERSLAQSNQPKVQQH